ncbi:MAG: hypothetical protein R3E52_02990 [Burkholderiaceae bacterium]
MSNQMETTRLSSKGQIVLPGAIRLDEVAGCLKPKQGRVSLDEMKAALAREIVSAFTGLIGLPNVVCDEP